MAGRYRLVRRLGSGGMGIVWAAEDERLGRMVAIKQLHVASDDASRRFQREAELGAALRHTNLITVFDILSSSEDGDVLLIMEYVEGASLAELLRRGRLETDRTLSILAAVAAALDHAHAHGIIHRDVKPANVLVGDDGRVRLADLGIATAAEMTRITRSGSVLGTPAYIAPEQLQGSEASPASDVYALGTVAFEMLAGRRAWEGSSALEVVRNVTTGPTPNLAEARPDLPAAAAAVLEQGMAREPERRPDSAGRFVGDLAAALEPTAVPEPPTAPAAPARPAARPARRRSPALLALAALLAGAIALATVLALAGGDDPPDRQAGRTPEATANATVTATATESPTPSATAAPAAPAAGGNASPTAAIRSFYELAADDDFDGAWALAGPRMRAAFGNSQTVFRNDLDSLQSIEFPRLEVVQRSGGRVTVSVQSVASHTDRTDTCGGTLGAVRGEGGGWLVEPDGLSCESA